MYDPEEGEIWVPESFLNIKLFVKDKEALRMRLGIHLPSAKGKPISYKALFDRLSKCGYFLQSGRENNLHFIIIGRMDAKAAPESSENPSISP